MTRRYVTRKDEGAENGLDSRHPSDSVQAWESYSGRGDPAQRFQLRRLCPCSLCKGRGKIAEGPSSSGSSFGRWTRCPDCRGEGRTLELIATCATPEAVGLALVTLGREGEWDECPVGILDTEGETGAKWIVRPWLPSPRNISDAGRVLQSGRSR